MGGSATNVGKGFENITNPNRYQHLFPHIGSLHISDADCEWYDKTRCHITPMDKHMMSILNYVESQEEPLTMEGSNTRGSLFMFDFEIG